MDIGVEELRRNAPQNVFFILVGNKCDLESQVSTEEAQEKALSYQAHYMDVSAKTGEQIENLYEIVIRKLLEIGSKARKGLA